jgi:hypothetical protein
MHSGLQAGVHDGEILIRKGDIDDDLGLELIQQGDEFRHIVSIDTCGLDGTAEFSGDGVTFGLRAGGEHDFTEDLGELGAFMSDDTADAAGSDDEDFM